MKLNDTDLANKELFNNAAQEYKLLFPEEFNWYTQYLLKSYIKKITEFFKGEPFNVLDIGAGTGRITLEFLKLGIPVTSVDISEEMLSILDEKAKKLPHYNLLVKQATPLDYFINNSGEKYSVICFGAVLHHLDNYEKLFIKSFNLFKEKSVCLILGEPLSINSMKVTKISQKILYPFNDFLVALSLFFHFKTKWKDKMNERMEMLLDKKVHKRFWEGNFHDEFFSQTLTENKFHIEIFNKKADFSSGFMTWAIKKLDLFISNLICWLLKTFRHEKEKISELSGLPFLIAFT